MATGAEKYYSEEYIKKNRTFPEKNTVILCFIIIIQIALIVSAICTGIFYKPTPQDIIKKYTVEVTPLKNGSLDIEYTFVWNAIDTSEDLTWVEIGMANSSYTVYRESLSSNIAAYSTEDYDGYTLLILDLDRAYKGGECLEFSFKINQLSMLCRDENGYFYEFIPGWFNATPIENYEFKWNMNENVVSADNADVRDGYYSWSGSLDCGGYQKMNVRYNSTAFKNATTVEYEPFDDSGAYNELKGNVYAAVIILSLLALLLIIPEVYIIDSYVSYSRGRGFLSGYGHRVHIYGRVNPKYTKARDRHMATHNHSHGGRGGGCACACACACAGGGRAGCSQKDTFTNKEK